MFFVDPVSPRLEPDGSVHLVRPLRDEIAAAMTHLPNGWRQDPKAPRAAGYPEIFFFSAFQLAIVLLKYQ